MLRVRGYTTLALTSVFLAKLIFNLWGIQICASSLLSPRPITNQTLLKLQMRPNRFRPTKAHQKALPKQAS